MKTYALILNGAVKEIISPATAEDGSEIPIADRYFPALVSDMLDITNENPMPGQDWLYDGKTFSAPQSYVASAPEILAANKAVRDSLLANATLAIAPLQDATDFNEATDAEKTALTAWKQYRIAVNRIDLTSSMPSWPTAPSN